MDLFLYNTFTKKKERFVPLEKGKVKMYTCGPTVYAYPHIGNLWAYLTADILRRYLEYIGYEVRQIKNITDVGHFTDDEGLEGLEASGEDKLEKAAKIEKKGPLEIAEKYIQYYLQEEKKLNIKNPHFRPRPTQEIDEIIKMIEVLITKGYAYETKDGIYFSVKKFPAYGKLSGNTLDQIKTGARVEINENKKDPVDFALWIKKVGKHAHHTLFWKSPWGEGFPGWHVECTAMATKYLGDSIDIHTGGEDNIFPHHECEIAQSETYTGKIFSRFWIHTRHICVDGKKMSKSLGNFYTLSSTLEKQYPSLEEKGYSPLTFRTLKLTSHYRSRANFTFKALEQAQKTWEKINAFYKNIEEKSKAKGKREKSASLDLENFRLQFEKAMDDDLNTPQALAVILDLVKKGNQLLSNDSLGNPAETKAMLEKFDTVFAILDKEKKDKTKTEIPSRIIELAKEREEARKSKDFNRADKLRKEIEKKGYEILDEKEGHRLEKK